MALDDADRPGWSGTARVVRGREVLEERSAGLVALITGLPCCTPRELLQEAPRD